MRKIWTVPVGQRIKITSDELLEHCDVLEKTINIIKDQDNWVFIVAGKEITSFGTEMALVPIQDVFDYELIYVDLDCKVTKVSDITPENLRIVQKVQMLENLSAFIEEPNMHTDRMNYTLEWCTVLGKIINILEDK